MPGNPLNKQTK